MRLLGIVVLVIGVIIAASAGIRLGETEFRATTADGRVALEGAAPSADTAPVDATTRLTDWFDAVGTQFLAGLLIVTLGAVMGRVAIARDGAARTRADGADFNGQLAVLGEAIETARATLGNESLAETRRRVEHALQEVVAPMIDRRGVLQRRFGVGGCALVIGPLSGAERQLNRTWSVLVDQHEEEAALSLEAAAGELAQARRALAELEAD